MSENGAVFLDRSSILDASDTEYRDVAVPEWGGSVRIRSISAAERERLLKASLVMQGKGKNATQKVDMPAFRVRLAALAMVDRDGNRLFREDDVAALGRKSAKAIELVSDVAMELAGMEDDTEDDGDEDDGGKAPADSATTPNTAEASNWPLPSA